MREWPLQKQYMFVKGISDLIEKGYGFQEACEFNTLYLNEKEKQQVENGLSLLMQGQEIYDFFQYLNIHRDIQTCLKLHQQFKTLNECLFRGSELLRRRIEVTNQLKQVMKYPIFLLFFLLLIIFICNFIIFPQFTSIFQSVNNHESKYWIITMVNYIPTFFTICTVVGCLGYIYYRFVFSKKPSDYQHKIVMNIPIIKRVVIIFYTYHFTNQLGGLLKNGVKMNEALQMMSKEQYTPYFQNELLRIIVQLQGGMEFFQILETVEWLRKDALFVIRHGIQTGNLDNELYEYSHYLFKYVEQCFFQFIKYIQPITFIFVAGMVVLIYSALMLPMFQMLKTM